MANSELAEELQEEYDRKEKKHKSVLRKIPFVIGIVGSILLLIPLFM